MLCWNNTYIRLAPEPEGEVRGVRAKGVTMEYWKCYAGTCIRLAPEPRNEVREGRGGEIGSLRDWHMMHTVYNR